GRVTSVQFIVDGAPLGSPDTTAPYTHKWNTGADSLGTHRISALVTTSTGIMNTAAIVPGTLVAGRAPVHRAAPQVAVLNPGTGQLLSGTVPLVARVTDDVGVRSVHFLVDGHRVGIARHAPWAIHWNTNAVTTGAHRLTARVLDKQGHQATTRQQIRV